MKSITLFTEEIDDLEDAIEELKQQLDDGLKLMKNSCGIVFCDKDTEIEELLEELDNNFDFPIMGCTALAMFTKREGYQTSGISMMVLTADDCEFQLAMTDDLLNCGDINRELNRTYTEASAKLNEKEKLIITYASKMQSIGGDELVDIITGLSGGVPVYGALASDAFSFSDFKVFCGKRCEQYSMAMLLISGNIKPLYMMEFSLDQLMDFSATVTSSEGPNVYTLDNEPFTDVLKRVGLESKQDNTDNVIMEFIGTPFLSVEDYEDGTKIRKMRNLAGIDSEKKSGRFMGNVTEGTHLHIGLMKKEDVQKSVAAAFRNLLSQMKESDYDYSMLLCNSCGSRYLILATEPNAETKAYEGLLPEEIDLMGFYSYGEIAPKVTDTGKIYNCFNNDTFTILAI